MSGFYFNDASNISSYLSNFDDERMLYVVDQETLFNIRTEQRNNPLEIYPCMCMHTFFMNLEKELRCAEAICALVKNALISILLNVLNQTKLRRKLNLNKRVLSKLKRTMM